MNNMYFFRNTLVLLWGVLAAPAVLHAQTPLGTGFTYQGQLKQAGLPVTGDADMVFHLWDAETGGALYDSYGISFIPIVDGLFTVELDFGPDPFEGDARWLEIEVEFPSGAGNWTTLSPRQALTATPYALYALNGPGSGGHWAANGDAIYNTNSGNVGIGTTSPVSKLDVYGHVNISSGSILSLDGSAVENYLRHEAGGLSTIGTPGLTIRGDEFVSVSCGPGGEVIHIDEYGIVGIGMDNPSSLLDVNGMVESSSGGFRFPDGTVQTTAAQGDGHSLDAADGDPVDALYVDNDGNVGIGTPSPSYPLHVEGAGTHIAYIRNNGASGAAVDAHSSGTAVRVSGGTYGLDAFVEAPNGCAVFAFNEGASGNGYGVFGETASPDGTGVYGLASNDSLFDSTNIGVHGRADGDSNATGVYGEATNTNPDGTTYGVRGVSAEGTGVRGENQYSGNYGCLGRDDEGVYGSGAGYDTGVYGVSADGDGVRGYNQTSGNYGILGSAQYGVEGRGATAGGHFEDADGSGEAYVGYGNLGVEAAGSEAGGHFLDADGNGEAYVADGNRGIEAFGSIMGGCFYDLTDSGYAHVGVTGNGINAYGHDTGGYFEDTDSSGYAYVAYGDRGIEAYGDDGGGYFEDTDGSSCVYVAFGGYAIEAYGPYGGGWFEDTDSGTWSNVASGESKIVSNGACEFVQNYPEDPGAVIIYAAPEGDEVATYTRGTARLQNGVVHVPLGETFKWVTNPDVGLTAHLTPRDDAVPLAVASLTTEELVVRGPQHGPGDVVFDYLIYGLRIGFEEVAVVREKQREAYIPSMADHRALYERRPDLRDYNALERFKRMRAAAGQIKPLDLSNSQALHDAIVEFDPAVHSLDDRRETEAPEPIETDAGRPREQRPHRLELTDPKDAELAELRARVETLEALVARLSASQNGGGQ